MSSSTTSIAFVNPPTSFALNPYSLSSLAGLVISDPAAVALVKAGQGRTEALRLTLTATSGVLLLPGLSPLSGISASGLGTSQIILDFTANQLGAVNSVLTGLVYAAPAGTSGLAYSLSQFSGPLGASITSGNIALDINGTQGPVSTISLRADTAILGGVSWNAGFSLDIAGQLTNLGGIEGAGAVLIEPDASLELPYNNLGLGGTSYNFGSLGAASLNENGVLIDAGNAGFGAALNLGTAGMLDFTGVLGTGTKAANDGELAISLAPGALLTGTGIISAGNFSESGLISGPGTILAGGGESLEIDAGEIGFTTLQVAAGGVLVLGPQPPLYGVFNPTPLTIDSSVTLSFIGGTARLPLTGNYADTLASAGGVIVIDSPELFAGSIANFTPGDRLIFPGLTGLTLFNASATGFEIAGNDSNGMTQHYTINAVIASGASLYVGQDEAGSAEIGLRDTIAGFYLNGAAADAAAIIAAPTIAQPLLGLEVQLGNWTTQSLNITLSVDDGLLSGDDFAASATLVIADSNPSALNTDLAGLTYTSNTGAGQDVLEISSGNGLLAGLAASIPITINADTSTTQGSFGDAGQAALFTASSSLPIIPAAAPGAVVITGMAVFADALVINGLSGTALEIGGGGAAVFDAGAQVFLGADATIGNASGAGLLAILSEQFTASGNLTIAAGSAVEVTGALLAAGSLAVESGSLGVAGSLNANAVVLDRSGTLVVTGMGAVNFATLGNEGSFTLLDNATADVAGLTNNGDMVLGGTSQLTVQNAVQNSGMLLIGPDANFTAGQLSLTGTVTLAGGTLSAAAINLGAGGLIKGSGSISGTSLLANGGEILDQSNLTLDLAVSLAGNAFIEVGNSAALTLAGPVSGNAISFGGAAAELILNSPVQFTAGITNMEDTDAIDLIGIVPSLVSYSGGNIGLPNGGFALGINGGPPLQISADGQGGTLLTLGGDMPCFVRGTRLLTISGYRPVEDLRPGARLITASGAVRKLRWSGWRTLDLARLPKARPIRFAPGALGPGKPARPVLLSPLHTVYLQGVLVPACHLVNGATITIQPVPAVSYYHVELDRHDILLAEGMAAESYLDTGNRSQLTHEIGQRGTRQISCAPVITSGAKLAAIRTYLHNIALTTGYTLAYHAPLRGMAAGQTVLPVLGWVAGRRVARFQLPAKASQIAITANTASPADTDPQSEDRREVSICLANIPYGAHLSSGWHQASADDEGHWMGEAGALTLSPNRPGDLALALAAVVQSWVPPSA